MSTSDDPICGNCGNPLSKHWHEDKDYCNDHTNGDVFTDNPSEHAIYSWLEENEPATLELAIVNWKRANGHET